MLYRKFKDIQCSQLGFGTMRLPILYNNEKLIDQEKADLCLQTAIDSGINYFDTAWPYHKQASEKYLGDFLNRTEQRKKVNIATKLPCWECHTTESFMTHFNIQLQNLQTDYIDFYLLQALDGYRFKKVKDLGVLDFLDNLKATKQIHYAGFSFHGDHKDFIEILNAYDWDFVQIQLNYMDENFQAGLKGLEAAAKKGCGVIIMEPLRGGQLATKSSDDLVKMWETFETPLSPAALAFKYLFNKPEITLVLSGMHQLSDVKENIKTASENGINMLTTQEKAIISELQHYYLNRKNIPCTSCGYCSDCPQHIPIAEIFKYYNEAHMYHQIEESKQKYHKNIQNKFKANHCIACHKCESLCPQQIPIIDELKKAHTFLT